MDIPQPGDRIRTFTGDLGVVIRPNRLDNQSLIVWPDKWGRLPSNTTNGPGLSLHHTNLTVLDPPTPSPAPGTPRRPNPTLTATASTTPPGVQR